MSTARRAKRKAEATASAVRKPSNDPPTEAERRITFTEDELRIPLPPGWQSADVLPSFALMNCALVPLAGVIGYLRFSERAEERKAAQDEGGPARRRGWRVLYDDAATANAVALTCCEILAAHVLGSVASSGEVSQWTDLVHRITDSVEAAEQEETHFARRELDVGALAHSLAGALRIHTNPLRSNVSATERAQLRALAVVEHAADLPQKPLERASSAMLKALGERDWMTKNLGRSEVTDSLLEFFEAELAKTPPNTNGMAQIFIGSVTAGAHGIRRTDVARLEDKFDALLRAQTKEPESFVKAGCRFMGIPTRGLLNYLNNRVKRGAHEP